MQQDVIPAGKPGRPFSDRQLDAILDFLAGEESFVFLESGRITPEDHRSLLFIRPHRLMVLAPDGSPADFFAAVGDLLRRGHWLAGWFAYELGYLLEPRLRPLQPDGEQPLAVLGVFDQPPLIYDHHAGCCDPSNQNAVGPPERTGSAVAAAEAPATAPNRDQEFPLPRPEPRLSVSQAQYQRHIEQIRQYIAAGDTYQVNYTLEQSQEYRGTPADLYRTLRRNQRVSYAGLLRLGGRTTLSFSPELFFRKSGSSCTVRPMKGTARRGITPEDDLAQREFLPRDSKNRSENVMIVDLLRNDLGRICRPGTVRTTALFQVESYETLHQMTSTIQGELRAGVGVGEIFQALFPCGSVTGAPKIRTMEIIRELENRPRGVYTGALGFLSPAGEIVCNVPIRTVTLEQAGEARMGIGSGIVYDSEPEREWRECRLKGDFLSRPAPPFLLFETLLWQPERGYRLLELHLERLLASAALLGFYAEEEEIRTLLQERAAAFNAPQRVRLSLAKDGELELTSAPFAVESCFSWRELPALSYGQLPRVTISNQTIDPDQPLLYHKTTCRQLYDRERTQALAAGYAEVLFTNNRGELSEGAVSNIFLRRDGRLLTPPLSAGLLNGVLRRHLLQGEELPLYEERLRPEDLASAAAIYIGNSLRGLTQVKW